MRPDLVALPPYRPGRAAVPGATAHKLSSNELPYGPLPSVERALVDLLGSVNRYPDFAATALVARLAAKHGVDPASVVLGAGSVEVVSQLVRALAGPGDEVVFAWRSFEAYPLLVSGAGATPVAVPLAPGWRHDLDAMAASITPRTRLVLVCTPNNPTGGVVAHDGLVAFLDRVPGDVVVLVDEAYVEFVTDPDAARGADLFAAHPNVVVARTFSKAYGLAGLRVGYALAPGALARAMRPLAVPFGVTALAQAAAVASLDAEAELAARIAPVLAERARVVDALRGAGYEVADTQANFVWLPLGDRADAVAEQLAADGVLVRPFAGAGVRVSVGTREAGDALLMSLDRSAGGVPRGRVVTAGNDE